MDHQNCGKYQDNTVVWSRDGKHHGHLTNGARHCTLHGCLGTRVCVQWTLTPISTSVTWPCTKGMDSNAEGEWRIL